MTLLLRSMLHPYPCSCDDIREGRRVSVYVIVSTKYIAVLGAGIRQSMDRMHMEAYVRGKFCTRVPYVPGWTGAMASAIADTDSGRLVAALALRDALDVLGKEIEERFTWEDRNA